MKTQSNQKLEIRLIAVLLVAQLLLQLAPLARSSLSPETVQMRDQNQIAMQFIEDCGDTAC
ncbi:MAG: hypothetical protein J5I90_18045 [Caldilineales bacterium]|nr:hypothetical protein [Caldilineales bacterium]